MEDKRNPALVEQLRSFVEAYNAADKEKGGKGEGGQAFVGKQIGYSGSVISLYLNGTYATPHKVEEKLAPWLNMMNESKSNFTTADYVPTSISGKIYQSIRNAHLTATMIIERGDAGVGKTKTAIKYQEDYPTNTVLITAGPCRHTPREILRELCRKLGLNGGSNADMFEALTGVLVGRKLLIFDEAQHLTITAIETLRSLWDLPETDFGVVFIGNHSIVGNIHGRNAEQYAQLNNRVIRRPPRLTKDTKLADIKLLFPDIAEDKRATALLLNIAQSSSAIRYAAVVYGTAYRNNNITYEGLLAAAKENATELTYH